MGAQDAYKATLDFWNKAGYDPTKSNYGLTSNSMTSAWNSINPGGGSISGSGPAYDRVSSIPAWLPREGTDQLMDQYNQVASQFDTKGYDDASEGQQSRLLTTALNAGNNAATDYANRARQAGGSGMGAGLIKAQATVGARKAAGEMELDRQKFDASQREKAAGLSSQIATTLGSLRDSYLKTLVSYATSEDATAASFKSNQMNLDLEQKKLDESARQFNWTRPTGGGYQTNNMGDISNLYGTPFRDPSTGLPSSNVAFAPTNRQSSGAGGIWG
jgi:hypothetical protein